MGTEMGAMWPPVQELLGPPEARRGRKDAPLEPLETAWPFGRLDLGALSFMSGKNKFLLC